jgi:large subunit ribosomal protein L4e
MANEVASKARVLDISGNVIKEITLPQIFSEAYRPDLIKRAVIAMQSHRVQPKGTDLLAGRRTSAESWGTGRGVARLPRIKGGQRAARAPQAVGGRQAHPPKTARVLAKKVNKKERRKAIRSAIAATGNAAYVRLRGHRLAEGVELPLVVDDAFTNLKKTTEVVESLKALGVWDDVLRAKPRKVRAGRGKMRGRRYKTKRSVLIVIARDEEPREDTNAIVNAAKNLPGVDVAYAQELNAELLAPGTHPGRLTIWTESSLSNLASRGDEQWE